ncbi:MAG: polyphosphate kinase 2, partial [Gammaproteobacteria bacterium]
MEKQVSTNPPTMQSENVSPRKRNRRRASDGDISPDLTDAGIESFVVGESIEAAQSSKETAIQDIIST